MVRTISTRLHLLINSRDWRGFPVRKKKQRRDPRTEETRRKRRQREEAGRRKKKKYKKTMAQSSVDKRAHRSERPGRLRCTLPAIIAAMRQHSTAEEDEKKEKTETTFFFDAVTPGTRSRQPFHFYCFFFRKSNTPQRTDSNFNPFQRFISKALPYYFGFWLGFFAIPMKMTRKTFTMAVSFIHLLNQAIRMWDLTLQNAKDSYWIKPKPISIKRK